MYCFLRITTIRFFYKFLTKPVFLTKRDRVKLSRIYNDVGVFVKNSKNFTIILHFSI